MQGITAHVTYARGRAPVPGAPGGGCPARVSECFDVTVVDVNYAGGSRKYGSTVARSWILGPGPGGVLGEGSWGALGSFWRALGSPWRVSADGCWGDGALTCAGLGTERPSFLKS